MSHQKGTPVTLITGYLGAGKTTLLNHLLANSNGESFVVIENEYALEFGIENEILPKLEQAEGGEGEGHALQEVFEFGNGCLCCSSSDDFKAILSKLSRNEKKFSRILVETTGLADPRPVKEMLNDANSADGKFYLEGIVTVVDAKNFLTEYQREVPQGVKNEAREQLVSASVIVLNKVDLVSPQQVEKLKVLIGCLNEEAVLLCTRNSVVNPSEVFAPFAGQVEAAKGVGGNFDMHDPDVTAECYVHDGCVDLEKLKDWLEAEQDLLRTKGVLFVEDSGAVRKWILQGVRGMINIELARVDDNVEPLSRLAIIGRRLRKNHLKKRFEACGLGPKSNTQHLEEDVVDGLWRQLHALLGAMEMTQYTRLRPAASLQDIQDLEEFIGIGLPSCVERSLLVHDGCDPGKPGVFYGAEWRLLSALDIKRILETQRRRVSEFQHISYQQVVSLDGIRDLYSNPMWIPLMANEDESEFIGVDMDPPISMKKGSIHHWGNRIYQRVLIAASWEQFLELMVEEAQECVDKPVAIQESYRSYGGYDDEMEEEDEVEMLDLGSRHEDRLLRKLGNKIIASERWKRMEAKISSAVREGRLGKGSVFGDVDPGAIWTLTQQIWNPDHFAYVYTAMLLLAEFHIRGCIAECPSEASETARVNLEKPSFIESSETYGLPIRELAEWIHKQGI